MYIYLIFFVLCTCANASRMKLIAGHVIFRHGDRTPLASYPSNLIKEENWPNGYGQLTSIGIEQQYRLGQYLRTRYGSILSSTFDPREIFVRSTDFDRTLMSAESNLHGLYHQRNISNNRMSVQPISMHTERAANDFLLGQNDCPIVNRITNEAYQSETFKQLNEFYQPFFEKLQMWTNASNITLYNTQHIPDSVLVAHIHNKAPAWATEDVRKTLAEINNIIFYFSFVNDTVKRIRGGPVIQDIWSNMNRSVHHDTFYKLRMYSAHDTTVSAALAFLHIHYPFQPQYASALFIDLYKQNQTYYVKVEYLNVTDSNKPQPYLLEGCPKVECPLDIFTTIYQPRFPGKAEVECENKPSSSSRSAKAMVVFLSSIVVGLFLITLVTTMFRKRQASVQYIPVLTRDSADKAI